MEKMLTKAEEQVMQALWAVGKGGLREVTDAMPDPKPHTNTVATVLKILTEKGFVDIESIGRVHIYSAKISRESYSERTVAQLAKSYFNGSFNSLVSFLVENKKVKIDDLEELVSKLKK